MDRLRSPSWPTPAALNGATFPQTLTTTALDRSSLRWFAASPCRATAEDPRSQGPGPPSPVQHRLNQSDLLHRPPCCVRGTQQIVPFLAFPPDVRRVVYTTNTIEALNRQIRKIIKTRGSFPNEDSARKLLYLAITRAQRKWRHTYNWSSALAAFRIHFGDRLPDTTL